MAAPLKDFHHYKGNDLTPAEKVERRFAEILLQSELPDSERESSVIWELKHSSGCAKWPAYWRKSAGLMWSLVKPQHCYTIFTLPLRVSIVTTPS